MTLAMACKLVFPATANRPAMVLRKVESITIESSWEMLTDTAEVTIPRNVKFFDNQKQEHTVREIFRNGDPVEIWFGYDDEENLVKEFDGFLTQVSADIPVKLKCEDRMYLLKRHAVNHAMKSTKLKDLIAAIVPEGTQIDVADFEISKQRFANTTAAKVLEQLQENNIFSYFKPPSPQSGGTLVVGKIYSDDQLQPEVFRFGQNVVDNNLQYQRAEDILILVKGTSTLPKGRKIIAQFGDEGGTEKSLSYYGIESKDALVVLCEEDYKKFKQDGYKGDLNVFGIPSMQHGQKAKVVSELYPDREGTYWIKRVTKTFDTGGIRQKLNLDERVA